MNHSLRGTICLSIISTLLIGGPRDADAIDTCGQISEVQDMQVVSCPPCDTYPYACDEDVSFGACCGCDENWDLWSLDNYVFLEYAGGRGLSYKHGYGSLGVFLTPPAWWLGNDFVPFVDVRGYILGDGKGAANVGAGLRYLLSSDCLPCWDAVVGVNVYYDYRDYHGFSFNQIGVGLEWLSRYFDVRVNGYFPVEQSHRRGRLFAFGDDLYTVRFEWAQAYKGFDAEIGMWLYNKTPCNWVGLYFAAGPYYYYRDHMRDTFDEKHRNLTGGKARLLAKINDYLDITISGTYDDVFHGTVQGKITLYLPLDLLCNPSRIFDSCSTSCCNPCNTCLPCLDRQIALQPVERNGIIVAKKGCNFLWNWSGACPCSDCDESYSCPSSSDERGGSSASYRSWSSGEFSSGFFRYPSHCSECNSSFSSESNSSSSSNGCYYSNESCTNFSESSFLFSNE